MKLFLFFLLLICSSVSFAQPLISEANISTTGIVGTGNNLPFWMTHNQLGKYSTTGNVQELTEGNIYASTNVFGNINLNYGADLALLSSNKGVDPKIIQAYLGLTGKVIRIQAGAFADDELFGGLSSSNGDLLRSLNYRPYPKVRLSTPGFIPFLFAKSWFKFNAEYDEGLLTDKRIVTRPHLHHKSLMMQVRTSSTLHFVLGINHYVLWGGRSAQYGQLPDRLKDYFRYVTGLSGSSNFLETEQLNVAGDHLGSYLLTAEKDFKNFHIEIRASHPFEDGSGMGFENIKDNLYTIYIRKNKTGTLLDELLFEYLYSKNQSGDRNLEVGIHEEHKRGGDDYFNHGIYQTGFTYKGQSMGTPFFEPIRYNEAGLVLGVANNSVSAFHLGAKGTLLTAFSWKGLLTYSRNFGTYDQPYNTVRQQMASFGELSWKSKNHPLMLSALMAIDLSQMTTNQLGIGLQAQWTLQ